MNANEELRDDQAASSAGDASGVDDAPEAVDIDALCGVIASLVVAEDFARALAVCVVALIYRDLSEYTRLSQEALAAAPGIEATVVQLNDVLADDRLSVGGAVLLASLVQHNPLALLTWLDRLLHTSAAGSGDYPEWVYGGDVLAVSLSSAERQVLGVRAELSTVYLCRARSHRSLAPVSRQHVAEGYYLFHWQVVPEVPHVGQRSRKVVIGTPDESFAARCAAIGRRGSVRIYVAEFDPPPVFDSCWVEGESTTGWYAKGIQNAGDIVARALDHLGRATTLEADVVVFPELTFPLVVREAVSDWLSLHAEVDGEGHGIDLVISGSFHDEGRSSARARPANRAAALNKFGDVIKLDVGTQPTPFEQVKLTAVDYLAELKIYEASVKGKRLVLSTSPLGIHAMAICLDLAQVANADQVPLAGLPIRWLWVPSMSPKVDSHQRRAQMLCLHHTVTVACANQGVADFGGAVGRPPGESGASFVWMNKARSSTALQAVDSAEDWKLFEVPVVET